MKEIEKTLKAFANRRRLAIIKYLKIHKEAPVGDIAAVIKLSFRSTSKHLGVLSAADIIEKEQRGPQIFYSLSKTQKPAAAKIIAVI